MRKYLILTLLLAILVSCVENKDASTVMSPSAIVGGEVVKGKEFHGVVAIVRGGDIICSGVVIDKRTVLTAAHCLVNQYHSGLSILTGNGISLPSHQRYLKGQYKVLRVKFFPKLDIKPHHGITNYGDFNANDVGILTVDRNFLNIKPYKIATKVETIKESLVVGKELTIVGFGYTGEDYGYTTAERIIEYGVKRKVSVPVVSFNNHEVDARADGKDSCYVDSGAPAFIKTRAGYQVLGIVSGSDGLCGENEFPAYYSLAFDSACWIGKVTGLRFIDEDFHCERSLYIDKKCSEYGARSDAKECAAETSQIIFDEY